MRTPNFFSVPFSTREQCEAVIAIALASANGPVSIFGPSQIIKVVDPGDGDMVPPTVQSDWLWRSNARTRGNALVGDWLSNDSETPYQTWG